VQLSHCADDLSVARMGLLTRLGRDHLPEGYWGDAAAVAGGGESARRLYLTLDDGPCPHTTPWLLEALAEAGVTATFFLVGAQAARHEHLVEKIAAAGHAIGNHSWNHWFLPMLTTGRLEGEIDRTNSVISAVTGCQPLLFRPPYGIIDRRAAACLRERGMQPVYWGAVPEDWDSPGADRVVDRVMRQVDHGSMIVLHEQRPLAEQTIAAAKEIICRGKELGFEFLPVETDPEDR